MVVEVIRECLLSDKKSGVLILVFPDNFRQGKADL
jgi:hypothetical protein